MAEKKKKKDGRITIDRELCKGCYLCISVCPEQLIETSDQLNQKGLLRLPDHLKKGLEKGVF